jgi:peptidoglycan/LPS O-acetylase OafA/YrhL
MSDALMSNAPTSAATAAPAEPVGRDRMLDGFRALAVGGVIFGHAISYRYVGPVTGHDRIDSLINRAGQPLAEAGVYLFFAISGYIITALMLREEAREAKLSLAAFYARRTLRILPPLGLYLATVALLGRYGAIDLAPGEVLNAAAFTCNTGFTDCGWFVAHTWSLAVEEQYYLIWPLLFSLMMPPARRWFAASATFALICIFLLSTFVFHSNAISFACIAAGATCALQPHWREALERIGGPVTWALAAFFLALSPLALGAENVLPFVPLLAVFVLFGGRGIQPLRAVLESAAFQFVGRMSYSLYLWQQLFLAARERFIDIQPPPIWLLPIVAWLSLRYIERPCIELAHRMSKAIIGRKDMLTHNAQPERS